MKPKSIYPDSKLLELIKDIKFSQRFDTFNETVLFLIKEGIKNIRGKDV